jgi:hypothetical protein
LDQPESLNPNAFHPAGSEPWSKYLHTEPVDTRVLCPEAGRRNKAMRAALNRALLAAGRVIKVYRNDVELRALTIETPREVDQT